MSDGNYKINIRTVSDTSGIDKADKALADLKGQAADLNETIDQKLAEIRGKAGAAGEAMGGEMVDGVKRGGKGFDIDEMIGKGAAIAGAAAAGIEIGTALADGIERIHERGLSWDAILGKYDARFDESLARWRDGMAKALEDLGKEPPPTLLDYLNQVKEAAKAAVQELEHLDRLQKMQTDAEREVEDEFVNEDRKRIENDPTLTPDQRDEALAGLDKQVLGRDADRRSQDRVAKETAALDKEELARKQADEAQKAFDEQKKRAEDANWLESYMQRQWTEKGNKGKFSEDKTGYGPKWAEENLKERGLSSAEEEKKRLEKLAKERDEAFKNAQGATTDRERLQDVNAEAEKNDRVKVSRKMAQIDEGVAERQQTRSAEPPPVGSGKLDEAATAAQGAAQDVGKSAERLATSTADSTSQIATDIRQMTGQLSNAMAAIQGAIADNSRSIAALAQRTDQASQMAAAALAAVSDQRAGKRPYNGR